MGALAERTTGVVVADISDDLLIRSLRAMREDPYTEEEAAAASERFARSLERLENDPAMQAHLDEVIAEVDAEFAARGLAAPTVDETAR